MRSTHQAVVSAAMDDVWERLNGDGLLRAVPGGKLERGSDAVTGTVTVRLGSTQVTYRVRATGDVDPQRPGTATVEVVGKEARGAGTLTGRLDVRLVDEAGSTALSVAADLEATGRAESVRLSTWSRSLDRILSGVASAIGDGAAGAASTTVPVEPPPPAASTPAARQRAQRVESAAAEPAPVEPAAAESGPTEPAPARTPIAVAALPSAASRRSNGSLVAGVLVAITIVALLIRRSHRGGRS